MINSPGSDVPVRPLEQTERGDVPDYFVIGVDLGGTKTRAALADAHGLVRAESTVPTISGGANLIGQVSAQVDDLIRTAAVNGAQVRATAIGFAGVPLNQQGAVDRAPNLGELDGLNFAAELSAILGHPVAVENDANAAAYAELNHGCGREYDDFVFVALGTGIGMGVVSGRRLLHGAHGAAGEIGFLPFGTDPLLPENQRRGPLEEATAGDRIAAAYTVAAGSVRSLPEIFDLAGTGDRIASSVVDEAGRHVAQAIAAIAAVLDPGYVALGGGIGSRVELLQAVRRWLPLFGLSEIMVGISGLGERASVVGAIDLALSAVNAQLDEERTV